MIDDHQIKSLEARLKKNSQLEVSIDAIIEQLEVFKKGFNKIEILRPAKLVDGIKKVEDTKYIGIQKNAAYHGRFTKFVPASGAASRMFKKLESFNARYEVINEHVIQSEIRSGNSDAKFIKKFVDEINNFAFCDSLKEVLQKNGFELELLIKNENFKPIIDFAISDKGLKLSTMPKAVIEFHKYDDHIATPIEEHIKEAKEYMCDSEKNIRIHFTISGEHQFLFEEIVQSITQVLEKEGYRLFVSYSVQKKSTDTIAVDLYNDPFDDNGKLLFRPAGHGALLENLNDINGDLVYIKNIDNVVPERLLPDTVKYKQIIGGVLVHLQQKCFEYLQRLDKGLPEKEIEEVFNFAVNELNVTFPKYFEEFTYSEKTELIFEKLNRPIRVCGMVKNEGEPGGGPFWVKESNGNISLQIVESSQIDLNDPNQKKIFESATHFNPVDLVCGLKNFEGENFDLLKYRDPSTGFITQKSKDGKPLKALELPGLWNGSMAFWNTIFVEVPITTFAPVKEVNDLLKPQHQS